MLAPGVHIQHIRLYHQNLDSNNAADRRAHEDAKTFVEPLSGARRRSTQSMALRHYTPEVRAIRVQRNRSKRLISTIVRVRAFTACASEREVTTRAVGVGVVRWVFTTR